jgi:hypothetical protein
MMVIRKITILHNSCGPDRIYLETDLPDGDSLYPNGYQDFEGLVDCGTGEEYVKKHFPDIPFTVVEI